MFFLELPVKPYVKQYIILNYGNPANFSSNKFINERFRKCLIKPSRRYNTYYEKQSFCKYAESIKIILTQDDFYRYGWELSPSDIISFGKLIEHHAKFLACNMISFYMTYMNEKDAILCFQNNFGFNEDIWQYQSLKKIYDRFAVANGKIYYTKDLTLKLEKLLLTNLSNLGTLLPEAIRQYENQNK
jgi:hypothetical protein